MLSASRNCSGLMMERRSRISVKSTDLARAIAQSLVAARRRQNQRSAHEKEDDPLFSAGERAHAHAGNERSPSEASSLHNLPTRGAANCGPVSRDRLPVKPILIDLWGGCQSSGPVVPRLAASPFWRGREAPFTPRAAALFPAAGG